MPAACDFAIIGSGPLAALLAGLLAHDHGKRVLRVAEPASPQRLPRCIDIALPFATRPASWRLMAEATRETLSLLAALDAGDCIVRQDIRITTDRPATAAALAHLGHIAGGHGVALRAGVFRDVPRLMGEMSLADSRVETIQPERASLAFRGRFGAAVLTVDGAPVETGQIVLADDAAIIDRLPETQRPALLQLMAMTATRTAPARRLASPLMLFPDRGVILAQGSDQTVLALAAGPHEIETRLASCLAGPFPLQRTATGHFRLLASSDGAPVIGRVMPSRLFLVAGLANAAAFLAPPLARFLAGTGAAHETAWFAAHQPTRSRQTVADFVAMAAAA